MDRYVIQTIFSALFYRVFKSSLFLFFCVAPRRRDGQHFSLLRPLAAQVRMRTHTDNESDACGLPFLSCQSFFNHIGVRARKKYVHTRPHLFLLQTRTAPGMLDRSPCGTGTCAVMATMHARGELAVGVPFVHESIIGSHFTGEIVGTTTVAGIPGESTAQPRAHAS
jgi:proline racemase